MAAKEKEVVGGADIWHQVLREASSKNQQLEDKSILVLGTVGVNSYSLTN